MAIFSTIVCTYITIINFENSFVFILLLCLSSYLLFNSYLELIVALTFIAPNNRKKSLEGKNWNNGTLQYEGPDVYYVSSMGEKKAPLAIIIHGWRSGSSSMLGRAELYLSKGFHVLIMELPGHGSAQGVSKWNAGVATRNFMHLFDNLHKICDLELVSKIYLHGHSMGAFVLLRYSRESNKLRNAELINGYILESPMTCYSEIFKESCNRLIVPKFLISHLLESIKVSF